ncbi:MAG TPA: hypothetical protein VFQ98_02885 [Gallionella sp.]|nr:hypothetical protein [Gallionella sp.]
MRTENYSPALQLTSLLPSQEDIKTVFDMMTNEDGNDRCATSWKNAVHRLTAGIVANPGNSGLWYDLACAFGLWDMMQWRYLFVAHRIAPENSGYMEALAWAFHRMGDRNQAIDLVIKAIATATREEDRLSLIESRMRMEEQLDTTIN